MASTTSATDAAGAFAAAAAGKTRGSAAACPRVAGGGRRRSGVEAKAASVPALEQFKIFADRHSVLCSMSTVVLRPNTMFGSVRQRRRLVPRSSSSDEPKSTTEEKTPFGYTRKDVLLIGVGVTLFGYGLKYGLELVGVDPLQAGNAVQLVIVLGMTVGWISTYMFRVANKDMTYAKQLRDYEKQVMEKRLESLSEAELQVLLEQVEEEKQSLTPVRDQGITFTRKTEDQTNAS